MARDTDIENRLRVEAVQFEYIPHIALDDINKEISRRNQSRSQPIIKTLVDDIATALRNGETVPPFILYRGRSGYVLIDGNNRFAAMEAVGQQSHDAYLVKDGNAFVIERLTQTWNIKHGQRFTQEERILKAIRFVQKHRVTMKDAARLFGLSDNVLEVAMRDERARNLLMEMGLNPARYNVGSLRHLHPYRDEKPVFRAIAEAIDTHKLDTKQTEELDKTVRAADSEAQKLDAIEKFKSQPQIKKQEKESRGGKEKVGAIRRRILSAQSVYRRLLTDYPSFAQMQINDKDGIEEFARRDKEIRGLTDVIYRTAQEIVSVAPTAANGRQPVAQPEGATA